MTTSNELFKPSPVPWTPHAYQKKAVKFLLEHAAAALFQDPGLGKTAETLAALKLLKRQGLVEKTLLIAPLRVCYSVWPREIEKWSDFAELRAVVLHGKDKEERLAEDADIYIINPEGLEWLLQMTKTVNERSGKMKVHVDLKRWRELGFDTLVVDELSKFKHPTTQRFKALKHVLPTFGRRWGLTGSPAANGLMDLFGQCYVLDEGNALGRFISHYRMNYFDLGYDGFTWKLKPGADQLIYKKLQPLALRMAAVDYLDMPEIIENDIYVDLPPKARAAYDALEDDLIARIDKRVVVATNAAAASTKCRQVAAGGVYLDAETDALRIPRGGREWVDLHQAKVDALEELVDELQGEPLLVAYDFGHDLARLQARFGKDLPYIGGGVTGARSAELEQRWNRRELPVLLGHPQAMAHGLNLQAGGHHVCWYTPTWNFELYDQLIRRVHRQGNTSKTVTVHRIIARDTVDEDVIAALRSKHKGQEALFAALKKRRRSR